MAICTWNGIATVKYKNEQECQRHARVKKSAVHRIFEGYFRLQNARREENHQTPLKIKGPLKWGL